MAISRTTAWSIWMIGSIFYAYQYVLRVMPNIMLNDIIKQFNIDTALFGQFSGIYYIGYSLMHLPIGMMLDRIGPKKVMSGCALLTVIGTLPMIFADYWIYPLIGRMIIGIGSSAAIIGTFKIIRMGFEERHFTRMLSLAVTIGLVGAIYGGGPVKYMCSLLGYQMVIKIFAIIGLILSVVTYLMVPNVTEKHTTSILSDLKMAFTNRKVILLCCFGGLMVGPLEGFADVWGAAFLKNVYGFGDAKASYLPSIIFVGMCFGAPMLSIIAEKTGNYFLAIIGAGIIMFIVFTALVLQALTLNSITVGFLLVGICSTYQILLIYKASTYVPENIKGVTTAVANMIIMSFGYGFHSLIGYIVNKYSDIDLAQSFIYGVSIIPATLAIGVIGIFMIVFSENISLKKQELNNEKIV